MNRFIRCFAITPITVAALAGCSSQTVEKPGAKATPSKGHGHDDHGGRDHSVGDHHGQSGHAPGGHGRRQNQDTFSLQITPLEVHAGKPTEFVLAVKDSKGTVLTDFEIAHEKLVHLIFIDKSMATFAHLHPEVAKDGKMTVSHTFSKGGEYYVYADVKPKGRPATTIRNALTVQGEPSPPASLTPNVPGDVVGSGWTARVSINPARAGQSGVRFEFKGSNGQPLGDLEPYLGAMGHLVVVNTANGDYAHAHPNEKASGPGAVNFIVHFNKEGTYKGWGQFKRQGSVFDVPFVVKVGPGQATSTPQH
jgi:hypothetical protein